MIRKLVPLSFLALVLLAVTASIPDAHALSYTVSGGSVDANQDDGLLINTSLSLPATPFTFNLNDGDYKTFNFFKIWTTEESVNSDDLAQQNISATLYFSDPLTQATVGGATFAGSIMFGLTQWGQVVWDTPAPTFVAPDGRIFQVTLSDEAFNEGLFGLNEGQNYGATVKATVKQIGSSYPAVPDNGSTAMLLGLSLLVIAVVNRRKVAF